eukprot:7177972-Alexandrium_andersonii.AAC.1
MAPEWIAAVVILATRTPLDSARLAVQQALHAACMDARAADCRHEFAGEGEPQREAEERGNAGQQHCPPPRSAPA